MRLVFTFAIALSSSAFAHSALAQTHPDPVLARMVPPGSVSILGVRMDEVKTTPMYVKMIAQRKLPDLDRFAEETGFDPRRDVREMLVASNGTPGESVVVARGSFSKVSDLGKMKVFKHGPYVIHGNDNAGYCILDSSTVAAGPLPGLYAALDHWFSHAPPATPELFARVGAIPASAQLWAVSAGGFNIPGNITMRQGGTDFAQIFRNVEQTVFWADLRSGLDATVESDVKTEDDAKNLGDAARGLIGIGRLSVPDSHRELLKLWDGFKVDQHARHITVTAKVPQDLIDQLVALLQSGELTRSVIPH
jgi:hypothetical protein